MEDRAIKGLSWARSRRAGEGLPWWYLDIIEAWREESPVSLVADISLSLGNKLLDCLIPLHRIRKLRRRRESILRRIVNLGNVENC